MRVKAELADLREAPSVSAPLNTQALHGERVQVFDVADGWAWCQLKGDSYVGYLAADSLCDDQFAPTHRVTAPRTFVYPSASIKAPSVAALPMGAAVRVIGASGAFAETDRGFIFTAHLAEKSQFASDFVAVAERFLNAPYLWGGKSWLGIDCSGLAQLALNEAGFAAPRDTDMLFAEFATPLDRACFPEGLQRGDLIFWKGHVGLMQCETRILHANGHHMMVVSESLDEVVARIAQSGAGSVMGIQRI